MKSSTKKSDKKAAFTIVELLTVMSIIVILIGLLVPALNQVRKYAKEVKQKAQFHAIGVALEFFNGEFESYPESGAMGNEPSGTDTPYCGAMKLAEAMVGKDLMGVHPDSIFNSSGKDYSGNFLYDQVTMNARKGPYLPIENANAYKVSDVYDNYTTKNFDGESKVLCDVFSNVYSKGTGEKIGMPILYYKASTSKKLHKYDEPQNSIYNSLDNQSLVELGMPFENNDPHELAESERFYTNTRNPKVDILMPFNMDTYILISAGYDGEYGTSDDICNFDFKYRPLGG